LTGTGLGLKIVKDIIEGYGGEVFVTKPKQNFTTTIRIELPKTDINDYE
jgi:signal transduction histidine kinase